MILTDTDILKSMENGDIVIMPFDRKALGTNSYDVHLAPTLMTYENHVLDCKVQPKPIEHRIPKEGFLLKPGELYLAATVEYTETHAHVPMLNGKSSIGRLGLSIHVTAGTGDVGFCNHWTMELFVIKPVRVYAYMPIGQLLYFTPESKPSNTYGEKTNQKYNDAKNGFQHNPKPAASRMFKNFPDARVLGIDGYYEPQE